MSKGGNKGNERAPEVVAIMGGTGSGKTTQVLRVLHGKARRRTLVWSPKEREDNYAGAYMGSIVVRSATDCIHEMRASGPWHIVFVPSLSRKSDEAMFSVVCMAALAARDVCVVVDELHTVTRPNMAPDGWRKLVMMGRSAGCSVIGASQRPASIDKDFFGNCSRVHVRRLGYPEDAKVCAKALGVDAAEVLALSGYKWLERNTLTGKVSRGERYPCGGFSRERYERNCEKLPLLFGLSGDYQNGCQAHCSANETARNLRFDLMGGSHAAD